MAEKKSSQYRQYTYRGKKTQLLTMFSCMSLLYRNSSRVQALVATSITPEKSCLERISISPVKLKGEVLFIDKLAVSFLWYLV